MKNKIPIFVLIFSFFTLESYAAGVSTWADFNSALTNTSVSAVELEADLTANSTGATITSGNTVVNGQGKGLSGAGYGGITVSGGSLSLINLGSFASADGKAVLDNAYYPDFDKAVSGFSRSGGLSYSSGAALRILSGSADIDNSIIANNSVINATAANFGAAVMNLGTISYINNSLLYSNKISGTIAHGGAVSNALSGARIRGINNTVFAYNKAAATSGMAAGGAIFNYGGNISIIEGGGFYKNEISSSTSTAFGGAIMNARTDVANGNIGAVIDTIRNTEFIENSVIGNPRDQSGGGAIYNNDSLASKATRINTIENVTFLRNNVSGAQVSVGGAIGNESILGIIKNSVFEGNTVNGSYLGYGGAIASMGTINKIINTSFISNTATGGTSSAGGAIYSRNNLIIEADGGQSLFSGNAAINSTTGVSVSNAIYQTAGQLSLTAVNGGHLQMDDGISGANNAYTVLLSGDYSSKVLINDNINNAARITLQDTNIYLGKDSAFNGSRALVFSGANLYMNNDAIGAMSVSSITLTNGTRTNISIDADLVNGTSDTITASSVSGLGVIDLRNVNVIADAPDANQVITNFASANLAGNVNLLTAVASSALHDYKLSYDSSTGQLAFGDKQISAAFDTPAIALYMASQVQQARTFDIAFGKVYAAMTDDCSGQSCKSKDIWALPFYSSVKIPFKGGQETDTDSYGSYFGANISSLAEFWGFTLDLNLYGGYNHFDSKYKSDRYELKQDIFSVGSAATVYNSIYFLSATGNFSYADNSEDSAQGDQEFNILSFGAAVKTGFNLPLSSNVFLQPSFAGAYTSGYMRDYSTSRNAKVTSHSLNTFQLLPEVRLLAKTQNGFSGYGALSGVFNLDNDPEIEVENLKISELDIKNYLQLSAGIEKSWAGIASVYGNVIGSFNGVKGVEGRLGFTYKFKNLDDIF